MNQEKQPDALRLASSLENIQRWLNLTDEECESAAAELRRLHALAEYQRAELVAEAARTAEWKLRADQMTEQHRMQTNIRKDLEQKVSSLKEELSSRDSWLAECRDAFSLPAVNTELDHHFCGAMTDPCEVPAYVVAQAKSLEAQLSAIGAGGVESLRKREQECGNCFEGKSDLDHTCRKCGGSGAAAPAQAQDDRAAFKAYLQECDDCAIVPDVAGAFHAAWQMRAAPAQAVAVPWDNFPAYLIDHCEGDTITEEWLQRALSAMLADPQYAAPAQEHATQLAGKEFPGGWKKKFANAVYEDLAAADNQDVPLEEYPARILKVLDGVVGPRHPVVVQWRNDAIRQRIYIAYRYCRDPESHGYLKQDLEALISVEPAQVQAMLMKAAADALEPYKGKPVSDEAKLRAAAIYALGWLEDYGGNMAHDVVENLERALAAAPQPPAAQEQK